MTLGWPDWLTGALLLIVIVLLFFTGQTMIFLLRLVAADRRGRRRPLAERPRRRSVELEDAEAAGPAEPARARRGLVRDSPRAARAPRGSDDEPTVRQ